MGIRSRRKGARVERELTNLLQDSGFAAEKVSRMYQRGEDLSVPFLGKDLRVEVKARPQFPTIEKWMVERDALVLKPDGPWRGAFLVVRLDWGVEVAQRVEKTR